MMLKIESLSKILRKDAGYYDGIHVYSEDAFTDIKKIEESLPRSVKIVGWWEQNGSIVRSSLDTNEKNEYFVLYNNFNF